MGSVEGAGEQQEAQPGRLVLRRAALPSPGVGSDRDEGSVKSSTPGLRWGDVGLGPVMLGTQHPCWEGEKGTTTTRGQRLQGVSCFVGGHMLFWGARLAVEVFRCDLRCSSFPSMV